MMVPSDRWFFDRVAGIYDRVMWRPPLAAVQSGFGLAVGPINRVLDVGGGTGRASRALLLPDRVVVDTSPGMLRRAPAEVDRVQASATHLPVADGAVDAVVIVDALHHFPDHPTAFGEAYRVLRSGGVLVVRDFDRGTVRGRLIASAERSLRLGSTFRTAREIADFIISAGFDAAILDRGFTCTVAGRKSGAP